MEPNKDRWGSNPELSIIVDEIEATYWVPLIKTPFEGLDEITKRSKEDCPQLHPIFAAFNSNLGAARDLLEFPYWLLMPLLKPVQNHVANNPSGAFGSDNAEMTPEQNEKALEFITATLKESQMHLRGNKIVLQRLLHQASLLIWSALETFSKQVFIEALNERPALFTSISKSQELKDRFSMPNAAWGNLLQSHDFDLKGKLGTIVGANRDFSSPQLLRDLFQVMFADISTLGFPIPDSQKDVLWKLGQRRHLIAHRCGIVDQDYLDKTHDTGQEVGKLLSLRGRDVGAAMGAAASFAIMLYGNARYCWRYQLK